MAEELQSLLNKIRSDGIDKANEQAKAIIANAENRARDIVFKAEKTRNEYMEKAKADAQLLRERSEQSIRQVARDVVLEVGTAVQETLERVLLKDVTEALSDDFMQTLLSDIIPALVKISDAADGVELMVPEAQAEKLTKYAQAELAKAIGGGLKITASRNITAGVRVMVEKGRVEHDFTDKAIMDAMAGILRPYLSKIIFQK